MNREIKALLKSEQKVIYLNLQAGDRISVWKKFRHPLRPVFNQALIALAKNLFIWMELKLTLLRWTGIKIGKGVGVAPGKIDALIPELITMDDGAVIGWGTSLIVHEINQDTVRIGKIHIGKNAVIGAQTTVRGGVRIGKGSIVAMNSFVNKDIPDGEVWGGVPARKIR